MRVTLLTIIVEDQTKAHAFYRDILGFVTREDIDVGNGALSSSTRAALQPRLCPLTW